MLGRGSPGITAIHQQQGRFVIGHVRAHRSNHGNVVDVFRNLGKQFTDFNAALAVFLKLKWGLKRSSGKMFSLQIIHRQRFAIKPSQFRLGIKVSTCEGPPLAKIWMTRFALPGNCGALAASGELLAEPALTPNNSEPRRFASPTIPKPMPQRIRKSRRVRNRSSNRVT